MRTLELLNALNERETGYLKEAVKDKKRKGLQVLFAELLKYVGREGVPSNEDLFFKVFSQKYSSDKNYLLRNELRLLNDLIYDFLVTDTFNNYLKKNRSTYHVWLARAFFDRKISGAFNNDIDRFIDFAKQHVKAEDGAILNDLKSLWMISTYEKNLGNIEHQRNTIEAWKSEQIRHLKYRLREMETRNAYLDFTIQNLTGKTENSVDDARTEPQNIVNLEEITEVDAFENYLILKKYSYQTKGLKSIEILKQKLAFEESNDYPDEGQKITAQIATLNSIATELILIGNLEQADEYLIKGIQRAEQNQLRIVPAVLQNYIANQINLSSYQKALDFYSNHESEIEKSRQFIPISIYKAYCHLFLAQPDQALKTLPATTSLTSQQNLMVRTVYVIAFILRNQFDLAINECYNLGRLTKAYEGKYYEHYNWINTLFSKYLQASILERDQRKVAMAKIKEELATNDATVKDLVVKEFALKWLVEEINTKM